VNWKTSALGIATVLGAVASIAKALLNGEPVDFAFHISAITAGLGLILAKDAK
jgi:hypothetical protein